MFPPWLARLCSKAAAEGPTPPPSPSQFSSNSVGPPERKLLEIVNNISFGQSCVLPVVQTIAGLGVLKFRVLVVPEGRPVCGLLSLESVDPPVERAVGKVIVYSSLQWENIYNHQDISQEIIEKWLNGQFSGLMTLHVKCSFYSQYSYSELLTAIMLNRGFNLHNEKPQEFPLVFTCIRNVETVWSDKWGLSWHSDISYLIYRHVACPHRVQGQRHVVLGPVDLHIIPQSLTKAKSD